jgi:hypothetical protein
MQVNMSINLPFESLYLFRKTHQNPMGSFKDVSIKGQTAGSDFALYYVMIMITMMLKYFFPCIAAQNI